METTRDMSALVASGSFMTCITLAATMGTGGISSCLSTSSTQLAGTVSFKVCSSG